MTALQAAGPGILLVLVLWVLWYLLDPPLRPEGVSWPRLILWLATPLGLYLFLARHKEPPSTMASPVGKEGTVAGLDPLEVEVFGSTWHARCDPVAELRIGDRVRVVEREGLTLWVERHS
jgi:membrane protein implicated in regulation of membrane protease activity